MTDKLRVLGGVAVERIVLPDGVSPADLFTPAFLEDLVEAGSADVGWTTTDGGETFSPPAPLPDPVPVEVSSAQAKIQLLRASFLIPVREAVKAIGGETEIWFNEARTWQRDNPHVVEIGSGLNLKPDEIDDLFRAAALINA